MKILQVSTADGIGGAEGIAWQLFQGYHGQGHDSFLVVGQKRNQEPRVLAMPRGHTGGWWQTWERAGQHLKPLVGRWRGAGRLQTLLQSEPLRYPRRWLYRQLGYEECQFQGSWDLLTLLSTPPDLIHCHNLHGPVTPDGSYLGYFDLQALPYLSQQVPVVLTLHDAWLLSGHCAHSFGCDRWQSGCGSCPDLTIYPAIQRDGTARNWRRKQAIYQRSRLYIATPSDWLMQKVKQSILAPAIQDQRVIPNGVDLTLFRPGDQRAVRQQLGIAPEARVLLFAANSIRQNPWKDYQMLRAAMVRLADAWDAAPLILLALGETAPSEFLGQAEIRFIPYQTQADQVAQFYQAADLYLHAAKVDTFPTTVLESLACGTPVVATAIGGIPEQVDHGSTGLLVPSGDAAAMATAIQTLLEDPARLHQMGQQAVLAAHQRFSLPLMVQRYLEWLSQIQQNGSAGRCETVAKKIDGAC